MVTKLPVVPAQMGFWSVSIPSNVIGRIIVGGIIRVAELKSRLGGVQGPRHADKTEALVSLEPLKIPIFPPMVWLHVTTPRECRTEPRPRRPRSPAVVIYNVRLASITAAAAHPPHSIQEERWPDNECVCESVHFPDTLDSI